MSATGVKAGEAYVELGIRSQIDKGLRQAGSRLKKFGGGMAAIGAAATGAAAAAIGKPLMLASEMEETMGKFSVVFGDSAGAMEEWSNNTAKALGTTRQEMAGMTSGMQDLLVPMGLAPDQAMEFSKGLSTLAVDLGSFNNRATPDVMNDLMAAMTGSGEVMKKYGVILNVANMEQKAYATGIAKTGEKLTDIQKAQAAYAIIMDSTSTAQGDAIRTQASFANQSKRLKAGLSDLGMVLGQAVLPPLTKVLTLIQRGVQWALDWGRNNKWAMGIIGKGFLAVGVAGAALLGGGGTLAALGMALGGVATAIGTVGTVFGVVFSPMGAAVAAIVLVVGGLAAAIAKVAVETGVAGEAFKLWKGIFNDIARVAKATFGGVVDAFKAGDMQMAMEIAMEGVKAVVFHALAGISESLEKFLPRMLEGLWEFAKKFIGIAGKISLSLATPAAIPGLIRDLSGMDIMKGMNFGSGSFSERAAQSEARLKELTERAAQLRADAEAQKARDAAGDQANMDETNTLLEQIATNTKSPVAQFG